MCRDIVVSDLLAAFTTELVCNPNIATFILLTVVCTCQHVHVLFAALNPFYIEVDYLGTWTLARQAVFQTAANRYGLLPVKTK